MTVFSRFPGSALPDTGKGIVLALISNGLFVTVGVCVRNLSDNIGIFQILLFRQLVFLTFLAPAIYKNIDLLMKPRFLKLHTLRVVAAFFALLLGFVTVSKMPLAEATALGFTKVLFVALISALFLQESVGRSRQLTLLAGFIGVVFVVQPSVEKMTLLYTLTGLAASLAAAIAVFCVRKIASLESTINLLVYQAVFVGLLALAPSLFYWKWPTPIEWMLLFLVGGISSVAQWVGVTAYKFGEANVIANVEYTQMGYSLLLGYYFFSEIPNLLSLTGVTIIISSVLLPYLLWTVTRWFLSPPAVKKS